MSRNIPLVVDLDHTLINTDLLYESSIGVLKQQPWLILIYPFWFFKGKGYLKTQLVKRFDIDVSKLPYMTATLDYIIERKKQGDWIVLATASHEKYALEVAQHLQNQHHSPALVKHTPALNTATEEANVAKNQPVSVPLFDEVMASNADFNLSSQHKARKLVERFGHQQFDYMGDHRRDIPVWEAAHLSILVNVSAQVIKHTHHLNRLILSKKN